MRVALIFHVLFFFSVPLRAEEKRVLVWSTSEGRERLMTSSNNDFFALADQFQPQINPLYCGIATSAIVLNAIRQEVGLAPSQSALEVKTPVAFGGKNIPFPAYSQLTLLDERTDAIKLRSVIRLENITAENTGDSSRFDPGLSLTQLAEVLALYKVDVDTHYADDLSDDGIQRFRATVKNVVADDQSFLICNFYGKAIGQTTGGHISPVAAYHKESDSLLVLDVAGHKNSWYWVDVPGLYSAMHAQDGNHHRGWLVVQEGME